MSSLGGVTFKVVPQNSFFPNVEEGGGDDPPKYECEAAFVDNNQRVAMLGKVSRGTAHRILGTKTWNWHGESGPLPTTLTVPLMAGSSVTFTSVVLRSITGLEAYGKGGGAAHFSRCQLEFWILSDITP